ncbi:hypothetical protein [uncultured Paludibaculum sp.]|uniref:hypothetical protein n=1 Tax=uncultured Paludibaculum sp. TaxID=1765020 RepID=UPI002AAA9F4A|nr:hypothetical protein [uncultured Paludibaculum sp.]
MSPRNSLLLVLGMASALLAQGPDLPIDPANSFKVNLPGDGPLALVSADWGRSSATARGGAMLVDLHSTLVFKNSSPRPIRGVSLLVLAQEVTPGGKASVTVPSLDIQSGESFPIRVDLRLMRPLNAGSGALVQVGLDGVLFEDLTFYGPNRLNARREMLAWELSARRDRKAMLSTLLQAGPEGLRRQLLSVLARPADNLVMGMQVARALPPTNIDPGRVVEFAFLQFPDSPVELLSGEARMTGTEARAPRIEIQSKSKRPIRFVELGWLARDEQGREFMAGTLPADLSLPPGAHSTIRRENTLRFAKPVNGLTAYPSAVEYADGELWVPAYSSLKDPRLAAALPASGEERRLAQLYRRKGLEAVVQELRALR